jgi:hypothetical protein
MTSHSKPLWQGPNASSAHIQVVADAEARWQRLYWHATQVETVINLLPVTHKTKEEARAKIALNSTSKNFNYRWVSVCE